MTTTQRQHRHYDREYVSSSTIYYTPGLLDRRRRREDLCITIIKRWSLNDGNATTITVSRRGYDNNDMATVQRRWLEDDSMTRVWVTNL